MTIEERMTRLERKNRRLTLALVLTGLAAILAVGVGMAAPVAVPDEVKAHKFTLVDADGKTRAELGLNTGPNGPGLKLFDENGNMRVGLGLLPDGPNLTLRDENGKTRVSLNVTKDSICSSILSLSGENGRTGAALSTDGLLLTDANGKMRAMLAVGKDGDPALGIYDARQQSLVRILSGEGGGGMVNVYNALGKEVVSVQANKKNCGSVLVSDQNGKIKGSSTAE